MSCINTSCVTVIFLGLTIELMVVCKWRIYKINPYGHLIHNSVLTTIRSLHAYMHTCIKQDSHAAVDHYYHKSWDCFCYQNDQDTLFSIYMFGKTSYVAVMLHHNVNFIHYIFY